MFRDFHGFGEQMPVRKAEQQEPKPLSVAQQMRKEAIEKLRSDLEKNSSTVSEVVRKKRKEALLTLLSNEVRDEFGDIKAPEDAFHYSSTSELESSTSTTHESNIEEGRQAA